MMRKSSVVLAALALLLSASLATAAGTAPAAGTTAPRSAMAKTKSSAASAATNAKGAAAATASTAATTGAKAAKDTKAAAATSTQLVDLNSATKAELMKLPGIGEAISDKIIKGRPWTNKAQLVSKGVVTQAAYDKFGGMVIAKQKGK